MQNHLVQKKIILINEHLPAHHMVATNPHVHLFSNQGVEIPALAIKADQLWKGSRITIFLAEHMCLFVFALEVEDINTKTDVVEVWVKLDMLGKGTVVIKENVIRFDCFHVKCTFEEFLQQCIQSVGLNGFMGTLTYSNTGNTFGTKHSIATKYHATQHDHKLFVMGS